MKQNQTIALAFAAILVLPPLVAAESTKPFPAYDPANNRFLVTYSSGSIGSWYVYARLYGPDGSPAGSPVNLYSSAIAVNTSSPAVFDAANSRYLVAWTPSFPKVYLRLLTSAGTIYDLDGDLTPEPGADYTVISSSAVAPELALDPANGLALAVMARSDYGAVIGQFIALDGSTVGPNFSLHSGGSGDYSDYAVTYDSTFHRFLAVFVRQPGGGNDFEITGQFAGLHGATAGLLTRSNQLGADPFPLTALDDSRPRSPDLAFNPALDRFLLVWQMDEDIRGQLVSSAGAPLRRDGLSGRDAFPVSQQKNGNENPSAIFDPAEERWLVGFNNFKRSSFSAEGQAVDGEGILTGSFAERNFTLADTGSYLANVRLAYNSTGQNSLAVYEYSAPAGHEIGALVAPPPPELPKLLSPADGAALTELPAAVSWQKIKDPSGAPLKYTLRLCTSPAPSICAPFLVKTARNGATGKYAFSAAALCAAGLVLAGGGKSRRLTVFFMAVCLGLCLAYGGCASDGGGGDDGGSSPGSSIIKIQASGLDPATTYYWQVEAETKDGSARFESEIRWFTTP